MYGISHADVSIATYLYFYSETIGNSKMKKSGIKGLSEKTSEYFQSKTRKQIPNKLSYTRLTLNSKFLARAGPHFCLVINLIIIALCEFISIFRSDFQMPTL